MLHVLWTLEIGGAERALFQLVTEQRRRGVEADAAVAARLGLYGERLRDAGATVHELGLRHALDLTRARRAIAVFRQYDVVHFHAAEPTLAALSTVVPARKYYTHRAGASAYPWKQRLRYRVAGLVFRRAFTRLSANTRHAAGAAAHLFKIPVDQIATTYNGLNFSLMRADRSSESVLAELGGSQAIFRVATTANLRAIKRVDLLIRAIALITEENVRCYVIGDGPERPRLERLAAELGLRDRVTFLGVQDNVFDYLQVMGAFVLPTGPEESFGNAAVEAMAVGVPTVVFSDGGGLLEHVRDSETGFIVHDTFQLARVLARLSGDPALATSVGGAGATAVRARYSLDQMVEAYNALYGSA